MPIRRDDGRWHGDDDGALCLRFLCAARLKKSMVRNSVPHSVRLVDVSFVEILKMLCYATVREIL